MSRLDVRSREYKVMLLPERFVGDGAAVRRACGEFWEDVGGVLAPLDIPTDGTFDRVKAHRRIRFFDTADSGLNTRRYVFRERIDVNSGEREVTLKFRHPDRYVASDRNVEPKREGRAETKFEEDVKPPFVSVFSYSSSVEVDEDDELSRVKDVVDLFPGLHGEVHGHFDDELEVVGTLCARELVFVGATLLLGKRDGTAECAMIVWHDDADEKRPPVCVEFSFRYARDDEDYKGSVAGNAHDVLAALHEQLTDWVHPAPQTKTAFVYG
jgi:hypothetical protein